MFLIESNFVMVGGIEMEGSCFSVRWFLSILKSSCRRFFDAESLVPRSPKVEAFVGRGSCSNTESLWQHSGSPLPSSWTGSKAQLIAPYHSRGDEASFINTSKMQRAPYSHARFTRIRRPNFIPLLIVPTILSPIPSCLPFCARGERSSILVVTNMRHRTVSAFLEEEKKRPLMKQQLFSSSRNWWIYIMEILFINIFKVRSLFPYTIHAIRFFLFLKSVLL